MPHPGQLHRLQMLPVIPALVVITVVAQGLKTIRIPQHCHRDMRS